MSSRLRYLFMTVSACMVGMLVWGAVAGRGASPDETYRHLAVYTEVLSKIKTDYVEEPDMKSVTLGAVNGLLESLDPFASYLNADQYKQWQKSREEKKADVGLILSKKFGYLGVVDSWPDSSAAKAGLNTGDFIETINGVSTRDMPLAYAEVLLRGEPGTTVELSVMKVRGAEAQKITLERTVLKAPRVAAKMLPDQIGYVQVPSTESGKAKEVAAAVSQLAAQGAKQLVLDFRNAAYGVPEEGVAIANLFLDKGVITYLQGQRIAKQNFEADPTKAIWRAPLVVLTNRGTATGAEVAAAALLDHKRAEVVGERSYGDAAQRRAITMEDGSAVILSVAKYYSPLSGKALQDNGVTPSVPVMDSGAATEDEEVEPESPEQPKKPGEDVILKRAIEVLSKGAVAVRTEPASASQVQPPAGDSALKPLNDPQPRP
jgi:carboxyl-terminal processing protease